MADMEVIARAMGIPWHDYVVSGLNAIVDVVLDHDQALRGPDDNGAE